MANEQNLKPTRTKSEARERGRKGGIASGEQRTNSSEAPVGQAGLQAVRNVINADEGKQDQPVPSHSAGKPINPTPAFSQKMDEKKDVQPIPHQTAVSDISPAFTPPQKAKEKQFFPLRYLRKGERLSIK